MDCYARAPLERVRAALGAFVGLEMGSGVGARRFVGAAGTPFFDGPALWEGTGVARMPFVA